MTRTAQSVTAAPSMTAPGSPVAKHRDWGPLQRGAGSVRSMNMAGVERVLSVIAGGALLLRGLRRFSWRGLLGAACGAVLLQRGISGHCPLYGALGIGTRKPGHGRSPGVPGDRGIQVERVVTIHAPPAQLFEFWRQLHNLPRIMQHLESVREVDARISHWVAKAPLEQRVEWYAQIINEVPNKMIAWAS
ncbi:MAG TPA: YgaP-like transmembrane domain, partial [Phycisphaerae bacterium]